MNQNVDFWPYSVLLHFCNWDILTLQSKHCLKLTSACWTTVHLVRWCSQVTVKSSSSCWVNNQPSCSGSNGNLILCISDPPYQVKLKSFCYLVLRDKMLIWIRSSWWVNLSESCLLETGAYRSLFTDVLEVTTSNQKPQTTIDTWEQIFIFSYSTVTSCIILRYEHHSRKRTNIYRLQLYNVEPWLFYLL